MIPKGARVLEIGCGTGSLSRIVADTCGAEVVGIEPDSQRAERAKTRGLEVHVGYLSSELIHEIGVFDVVLLADVLEHVPNPHAMLSLSRQALKPGGAVIISVPNVAHWSVRANLLRGKFKYESHGIMDATHLRWFTAVSIRSLVASSGFKITEYHATACPDLIDNACRRPLSWLPPNSRRRFLRFASRRWPTVFGVQHVVKAETA
jgi:methionine biosynthesis protein MetW